MSAVPQVTEQDLLAFHLRVFGREFQSSGAAEAAAPLEELAETEDDKLGFYADGTKRTLTDEQIEIFRHSEIHALLQAHRRAEAAAAADRADSAQLSEGECSEGEIPDETLHASRPDRQGAAPVGSKADALSTEDEEDEAEYAQFLEREREEFQAEAALKRYGRGDAALDPFDRTVSTRRKVREMDALENFNQALDYGDDDDSTKPDTPNLTSNAENKSLTAPALQGRKLWWPELKTEDNHDGSG